MNYFEKHLFFCLNQRDEGRECCANFGAESLFTHTKKRIHDAGMSGAGKIRINKAGCLDRCASGPVAVVYPEGVWYQFVDQHDVDEIIDEHLLNGRIVERLRLPNTDESA